MVEAIERMKLRPGPIGYEACNCPVLDCKAMCAEIPDITAELNEYLKDVDEHHAELEKAKECFNRAKVNNTSPGVCFPKEMGKPAWSRVCDSRAAKQVVRDLGIKEFAAKQKIGKVAIKRDCPLSGSIGRKGNDKDGTFFCSPYTGRYVGSEMSDCTVVRKRLARKEVIHAMCNKCENPSPIEKTQYKCPAYLRTQITEAMRVLAEKQANSTKPDCVTAAKPKGECLYVDEAVINECIENQKRNCKGFNFVKAYKAGEQAIANAKVRIEEHRQDHAKDILASKEKKEKEKKKKKPKKAKPEDFAKFQASDIFTKAKPTREVINRRLHSVLPFKDLTHAVNQWQEVLDAIDSPPDVSILSVTANHKIRNKHRYGDLHKGAEYLAVRNKASISSVTQQIMGAGQVVTKPGVDYSKVYGMNKWKQRSLAAIAIPIKCANKKKGCQMQSPSYLDKRAPMTKAAVAYQRAQNPKLENDSPEGYKFWSLFDKFLKDPKGLDKALLDGWRFREGYWNMTLKAWQFAQLEETKARGCAAPPATNPDMPHAIRQDKAELATTFTKLTVCKKVMSPSVQGGNATYSNRCTSRKQILSCFIRSTPRELRKYLQWQFVPKAGGADEEDDEELGESDEHETDEDEDEADEDAVQDQGQDGSIKTRLGENGEERNEDELEGTEGSRQRKKAKEKAAKKKKKKAAKKAAKKEKKAKKKVKKAAKRKEKATKAAEKKARMKVKMAAWRKKKAAKAAEKKEKKALKACRLRMGKGQARKNCVCMGTCEKKYGKAVADKIAACVSKRVSAYTGKDKEEKNYKRYGFTQGYFESECEIDTRWCEAREWKPKHFELFWPDSRASDFQAYPCSQLPAKMIVAAAV